MSARIRVATVQEVAAFLRLKESTVCILASQGKLPGFKLGKSWRFDMEKIEWLFTGALHIDKDRQDREDTAKEE